VEDGCGGNKTYYDGCGNSAIHTSSDFFNPPKLGSPVYFQYNTFTFTGILQNWKKNKTSSGEVITVRVTDPKDILAGTSVILGGYNGNTGYVPNLLNVYGFLEEYNGTSCPIDPSLQAMLDYIPAAGFGGSRLNEAGLRWNDVRAALGLIINAVPTLYAGRYGGRLQYRDTFYYVDISELPATLDDYRLGGDSTTLLSIIDEVCAYANMDWFCELIFVGNSNCNTGVGGHISSTISKFIKIRTIRRFSQPVPAKNIDINVGLPINTRLGLGKINQAIQGVNNSDNAKGLELRNEVTNAVIIGDKRQDVWQIEYDGIGNGYSDTIWPYWGKDRDGRAIVGSGYNDLHTFTINISGILPDAIIANPIVGTTYNVTARELSCILDGVDTWKEYVDKYHTSLSNLLSVCPAELNEVEAWKIIKGAGKGYSLHDTRQFTAQKMASEAFDPDAELIDRLYDTLYTYARDFFGKQFIVRLPITCYHADPNKPYSTQINWDVSDGGWTENSVLGIANDATELEVFRGDDGRIGGVGKFNTPSIQLDLSAYVIEDYIQPTEELAYVKCKVDDIIFLDPIANSGARAVISFDNPIYSNQIILEGVATDLTFLNRFGGARAMLAPNTSLGEALNRAMASGVGFDTTMWGVNPTPILPDSVAIPLRSTNLTYGPWKAMVDSLGNVAPTVFGSGNDANYGLSFGAANKTTVEVNASLNPWTFGSTTNMNFAGSTAANGKISRQEVIEVGSFTVAGSPSYSLGQPLLSSSGVAPEITNILVNVGEGAVTTTYEMRTFTPNYGAISQVRIDSMRRQGEMGRQIQRLNNLGRLAEVRGTTNRKSGLGVINDRPDRYTRTSSHPFIFGEALYDYEPIPPLQNGDVDDSGDLQLSSRVLTPVVFTDLRKALPEMNADNDGLWQRKAGMELNGLFRPYSTNYGYLSNMPQTSGTDRTASYQNQFFQTPTCPSSEYNYANHYVYMDRGPCLAEGRPPIVAATLNPFLQPSGDGGDGLITTLHNPQHMMRFILGSGCGHDIEYIIRDGAYPIDLSVLYPSGNYSEDNWYRAYGVKTPLVLVGWGYDVYGRPVPNKKADNGNPTAYFEDNWLQKPQDWKAGPLDVRWDDSRGVWTAPPSYRIVQIQFCESALGNYNVINAKLHTSELPQAYNQEGSGLANRYINVRNPLGFTVASGTSAWAFYDPSYSGGLSENYADYQLLYYNSSPAFTIRTNGQGQGSGYITSASPFASDMTQWNAYINGGPDVSGYNYQCTFSAYDESTDRYTFMPQAYPTVLRGGTLTGSTTADLGAGAVPQSVPVINSLQIPVGARVNLQWNNSNSWIVVNSEAFNSPVTNVVP